MPTDAIDAIHLAAQLGVEEENVRNIIMQRCLDSRPKNTKKAFVKKQQEFVHWAKMKGYSPPETVYEEKLLCFLNEAVLGRESRNKKRSDSQPKRIGKATIVQYVTAITSLWKFQREQKINNHASPRGDLVKYFLYELSRNTYDERKKSYFDRGQLYQHLLTNEMKKNRKRIAEYFWNCGKKNSFVAFKSLRNRAGYLLSEYGLLRGENVRDLQLPDFFCVEMEEEGPTDCNAMVILKGRGKRNQYGKALFSGYYRHSDVALCSVSCIAFYLFLR